MQRILFEIMPYHVKVVYKNGTELHIADTLSRDCDLEESNPNDKENSLQICAIVPSSVEKQRELREEIEKNKELKSLRAAIVEGWPEDRAEVPEMIQKYRNYREQLASYDGLIFKNQRLFIPKSMVPSVLRCCHFSHKGLEGTLRLARDSVFWINMAQDIKNMVMGCKGCLKKLKDKLQETLVLQEVPESL